MDSQAGRKVFYDDTCPVCEAAARKLRSDIDLSTIGGSEDLPHSIDKRALMDEVHAMDENGTVYRGVDAIIVILRWHPRLFWLSPIVALPGIKQATAAVYRVVARNRHRWFGRR